MAGFALTAIPVRGARFVGRLWPIGLWPAAFRSASSRPLLPRTRGVRKRPPTTGREDDTERAAATPHLPTRIAPLGAVATLLGGHNRSIGYSACHGVIGLLFCSSQ